MPADPKAPPSASFDAREMLLASEERRERRDRRERDEERALATWYRLSPRIAVNLDAYESILDNGPDGVTLVGLVADEVRILVGDEAEAVRRILARMGEP